jgi:hypothetical protein
MPDPRRPAAQTKGVRMQRITRILQDRSSALMTPLARSRFENEAGLGTC